MSESEAQAFLQDIGEAIRKIESYTQGLDSEAFKANELVVDAVLRNLEVIGEAVKRLPSAVTQRHQGIEWKKIAGLRDVLTHAYGSIDLNIIEDIVQNKLPDLKRTIVLALEENSPTASG